MEKTNVIYKFLSFNLLCIILLGLPSAIFCQSRSIGTLNFIRKNDFTDHYVKINDKQLIDQQTIESPSDIEVPIGAELFVDLSNRTLLRLDSDTKINLAFDETKITGLLFRGSVTVKVPPNVKLDIQTIDGLISTPYQNQENVVAVNFVNDKTQVKAVFGAALFNRVLITSGESFTAGEIGSKGIVLESRSSIYSYFIIPAATILFNLFESSGPTSRSNFGTEQTNVGPMK